jgi:helicase
MEPSTATTDRRSLSPPQEEVLARGLLDSGFNCLLHMPTGSGKTWLAEEAIAGVLGRGRRAVYLTPLRALAAELVQRWGERFAPAPVGVFTGDYGLPGKPLPVRFPDARVLVMTPERLDLCTRAWRTHWDWIPDLDLVVVDEFHLLDDRRRGARLEGALSRLRRLNPFARLLGLSATLGNLAELADWLGAVDYVSSWRPVPLRWRTVRYRQATDKPALLAAEVSRTVAAGGKSLVFVQSRRRAEELAQSLRDAGLRALHHHAGLSAPERRSTEGGFRGQDAEVLVATATLEMGLNLPVRQVVLYDLQAFDGSDYRPLPVNSVWQRAGRAGRPGLDDAGEVVLLAPAWDRQAARYAEGRFEAIRSGLADPRALAEQVVAETASGLCRTARQLERVFRLSLADRQGALPDVGRVVDDMCRAGMIQRVRDEGRGPAERLRATRLGHVATRHLLGPATVLLFRWALGSGRELAFADLLLVAASSDDCEPVLPVDFEELDQLADRLAHEVSFVLSLPRRDVVGLLEVGGRRLLAAIKTALVARDWTRSGDARQVADRHGCYPFEVLRLRECLLRLLLAFAAVADAEETALDPSDVPVRERLEALRRMIAGGLDEEAASLTVVPGVGATTAARLREAGIPDVEALAQADPGDLSGVRGVSAARAARWVAAAEHLVQTRSAFRYRETGPRACPRPPGWPADVDPYRLRRSLELVVRGAGGGVFLVTGGLEPHRVCLRAGRLLCDCRDAAAGQVCKHALAVRLHCGDRTLREVAGRLGRADEDPRLDLFGLWFDSPDGPVPETLR